MTWNVSVMEPEPEETASTNVPLCALAAVSAIFEVHGEVDHADLWRRRHNES